MVRLVAFLPPHLKFHPQNLNKMNAPTHIGFKIIATLFMGHTVLYQSNMLGYQRIKIAQTEKLTTTIKPH